MYSLIKKLSGIGPTSTDILKDESGHSITEKEKIETGKSFPELAEYPLSQWRPHSPNCRATILRFFGPPSYDDIHKLKTTKREVLTAFPRTVSPWRPISMPTAAGAPCPNLVTPENLR